MHHYSAEQFFDGRFEIVEAPCDDGSGVTARQLRSAIEQCLQEASLKEVVMAY